ncbi:efflux RND transporter periplasmic adaptor subunit [Alsobacter sp. R-9]
MTIQPAFARGAAPAPASPLETVLSLEAAARAAADPTELVHGIANDWRRLLPYGQCVVARTTNRNARVLAVSAQSSVERTSPLVVAVERGLAQWVRRLSRPVPARAAVMEWTALCADPSGDTGDPSPFAHVCLVPFVTRDGRCFGVAVLARDMPWTERDTALASRLGESYGHAWAALLGRAGLKEAAWKRWVTPVCVALLLGAGLVPVRLTALAPVEVVPRDADVVSAPMEGLIDTVEVAPDTDVRKGQVLVRMVDTAARSRFEVAEQNVAVARAREQRLTQAAFADKSARRELAVASAELGLAEAERNAAREQLARSTIVAERDGVAVFASRKDLEGKPVTTGERLMTLADPKRIEFRIELPVKDAIVARDGAAVRIYLDSDPLAPLDATVEDVAFHATPVPGGGLALVLRAVPDAATPPPRIGYRGTAQVRGEPVPLGYLLLRRPITALRQQVWL